MATTSSDPEAVREAVRDKYAAAVRALTVLDLSSPACCTPANNAPLPEGVPSEAFAASLGCGNPTALATLQPGETVLDLGSGGGLDALLAAKGVGPSGLVYGLDMTDEMLLLAEENRRKAGVQNVRLLKGYIEEVPLPDGCVDVVISNCVINLSTDKAQVLREAFRVLKPGGRLAVSDIVVQGDLPMDVRRDIEAWVGCVAGALTEEEYRSLLAEAGFERIDVQVTRAHDPSELAQGPGRGSSGETIAGSRSGSGRVVSAFISAWKAG